MKKPGESGKNLSRRRFLKVGAGTALVPASGLLGSSVAPPAEKTKRAKADRVIDVVVGSAAPELERFAACELCDYLAKLYGIQVYPTRNVSAASEAVFLIGSPETNAAVKRATARQPFPKVSDQGIVLRRTKLQERPALVVGGGSPQATLWAVYELVERWGVRYLVDRDVLPENVGNFEIPELDVVMEPIFRVRAHPSIQDYAPSGESWGMADFRVLINQLAKMKFNRLNFYAFGYQPYLPWEYGGIKRQSATLWYDYNYPITDDMVGRELFEDRPVFWNPDLPIKPNTPDILAAGVVQGHLILDHGHRRGMECSVFAPTIDFQPEFAPLLKGAEKSGQLTIRPGLKTPVTDPVLFAMSSAVLRATVDTYPEADHVNMGMPEEPQWRGEYARAWKALDARYGINQVRSLADALDAAGHRKGSERWPGKLGVQQLEAAIVGLDYYDRLLRQQQVLKGTLRPDMKFIFAEPPEELWPILGRTLPGGCEVEVMPENQPEHFLPRAELLGTLPVQDVPGIMNLTLDDDVVGLVPQIRPKILYEFIQVLQRYHWTGFVARERFPGDHDTVLAYLARAAWDPKANPDMVAQDLLSHVCGEESAKDMLIAFHDVESANLTVAMTRERARFAYYVPGMLMKYWKPGPVPDFILEVQRNYEAALQAAMRARKKAKPEGSWWPDFWVGRLEFALGYVKTVESVIRSATAEAANNRAESLREAKKALQTVRQGTEAYARVARTRTDLGAIAVMNEYACRPLKAKIAELEQA
jgi:hypothetical protein